MTLTLSIQDTLTADIKQKLERIGDRRPILQAMAVRLKSITERSFREAALRAAHWAPLKPATLKRKKGKGSILISAHGHLSKSIAIANLTDTSITVGTDVRYAPYLQMGTKRGLPPRPFFPFIKGRITHEAQEKIQKTAETTLSLFLRDTQKRWKIFCVQTQDSAVASPIISPLLTMAILNF